MEEIVLRSFRKIEAIVARGSKISDRPLAAHNWPVSQVELHMALCWWTRSRHLESEDLFGTRQFFKCIELGLVVHPPYAVRAYGRAAEDARHWLKCFESHDWLRRNNTAFLHCISPSLSFMKISIFFLYHPSWVSRSVVLLYIEMKTFGFLVLYDLSQLDTIRILRRNRHNFAENESSKRFRIEE